MKVNFSKIDLFVPNMKADEIVKIKDGIVFTDWKDGQYPNVNYKGFSICKYGNKDFRVSKYGQIEHKKVTSFVKAKLYCDNYGKINISIADLISQKR